MKHTHTLKALLTIAASVALTAWAAAGSPPAVIDSASGKGYPDIQTAIDNLPDDREYLATVKVRGRFEVGATLRLPNFTRLDLTEAYLVLSPEETGLLIANTDPENGNHHIEVVGGRLQGNAPAPGTGESHGISFTRVNHARISGSEIRQFGGDGIRINGRGKIHRNTFLSSLVLESNGHSGLNIMWASRNVFVTDVLVRGNKVFGLRSDHSECSYSNIQADNNEGDGIFIRNIFGGNYVNLTATRNGKAGIVVQGMVASLGSNWAAHNNSTSEPGRFSEIFFSADASLSYGITANTAITGINAGSYKNYGEPSAKNAIEWESPADGDSWDSVQVNSVVTLPTLEAAIEKPE